MQRNVTSTRSDNREAEEVSAFGLTRDAAFPELALLAGWCAFTRGANETAIAWSQMAASIGCHSGSKIYERQTGLRHLPAWYEAPFDVLRFALRRSGKSNEASIAERGFLWAKKQ